MLMVFNDWLRWCTYKAFFLQRIFFKILCISDDKIFGPNYETFNQTTELLLIGYWLT